MQVGFGSGEPQQGLLRLPIERQRDVEQGRVG